MLPAQSQTESRLKTNQRFEIVLTLYFTIIDIKISRKEFSVFSTYLNEE
jgi:hypothetical protein